MQSESVEGDMGEKGEVVLPFELDVGEDHDLLSLSEEMQHLLNPGNTLRTPPPLVDLSPLECHAIQMEEVATLTAIYGSDLQALNDQCTCFLVRVKFLSEEIKDEDVIRIWFSLPASYPCVPPVFEIEANASGSFNYSDADDLFDLLMKESLNRVGDMMVFDLVTIAQDYMPSLIERKCESSERRQREERERRERLELEEAFRDSSQSTTGIPSELWDEQSPSGGEEGGEGEEEGAATPSVKRKRRSGKKSVVFQPAQFVGPISNFLKTFPEGLQIQRIENILRQDLAERFHHCQQAMVSALAEAERRSPQMYNLKTQVAFHGTLTRTLPSIVEQGLVIPGAGNKVKVRCGSSLGVGIYLSPSPHVSLSYTDSNRLLVCAAILGRVYHYGSTKTDKHHSRFNALVCGGEWVFFNAAQVLPCYVIVVREGGERSSRESHPPPLSSLLDTSHHPDHQEENAEQKKARLAARARKFLPYGFGPGSKTVILDAASVDDDEEDYGDYQLLRTSGCQEDGDLNEVGVIKEKSALQEYRYTSTAANSVTDTNT